MKNVAVEVVDEVELRSVAVCWPGSFYDHAVQELDRQREQGKSVALVRNLSDRGELFVVKREGW